MDNRIIAMSGTHGSSKSSLAYSICAVLKKKGYNIVVLDELARECPFPINKDSDVRTQTWLMCNQIVKEIELLQKYEYVIVDRSVLDSYCYNEVVSKEKNIANDLFDYVKKHIDYYYKHTYIPDPDIFDYNFEDGVRDTDKIFRKDVHAKIIQVMTDSGLTNYSLITNEGDTLVHILDSLK